MSDKKRKGSKNTIVSVYISKITVFLVIALAATISVMVIAMPMAVSFVHKVEAKFPMSSADIRINDEFTETQKADYGDKIGTIQSESCGLNCNLYYGANRVSMRYGAGLSGKKSTFDGYTYITGYGETYFAPLHYIKSGDIINVKASDFTGAYKVIESGYVEKGKAAYNGNADDVLVICSKESDLSEHNGDDFCVIAVSAEEVE